MSEGKKCRGFSHKSNFTDVVNFGNYQDKTLFIKDLIDCESGGGVVVATRPRRFGKSLNLSMIRTFFEKTDKDKSVLFRDLDIWKCGERYTSEQGKYPVVFLELYVLSSGSWQDMLSSIKCRISEEYRRFSFVESSLRGEDAKKFKRFANETASDEEIYDSLRFLCDALSACCGVKPIVLVDDYDVPVQRAFQGGYYPEAVGFMKSMYSAAFGEGGVTFVVLTGAMNIAKEDMFAGLKNVSSCSVTSERYSRYFGLTAGEIKKIVSDFDCPKKEKEIRAWYGGYRFGGTEIFNPWSLCRYFDEKCVPDTYWYGSSEHAILKMLLKRRTTKDVETLRALGEGVPLTHDFAEKISYGNLYREHYGRRSAIYGVMLATGFITPEDRDGTRVYVIPNEEVRRVYKRVVLEHL